MNGNRSCGWASSGAEADASGPTSASCYDGVEDIRVVSTVEPERKFIEIKRQVFGVADNPALQDLPERFDGLGVNHVRASVQSDML